MTTPYTYYLYHRPTGKKYYGSRYAEGCHPSDLWNKYFSSCKKVHMLIEEYGIDSFDVEVRKTFEDKNSARLWEQRVLWRLKVKRRLDWLNSSYGKGIEKNDTYGMLGKKHSEETKAKMRKSQSGKNNPMYGKTHSKEIRHKISEAGKQQIWTEERKIKLSIAAKKRGFPEETRVKSQTPEVNAKRSETVRKIWAQRKANEVIQNIPD